ncbi:hypothetical protein ABKZ63_003166 [Salmonella enterica]|nr:hypothetical protein [Salmonella enterica]EFO8355321.1 hypothetical protein [Salmonella enterica]
MDKIIEFLHHYSPLISLITFFIGLYVGNRQALWVDKRREFNALAEPLLAYYEQVIYESGNRDGFSSASLPSDNVNKVRRRLPKRKQAEFVALFERIAKIKPRWAPEDLDEIHQKAKRMCKLLRLR